MTFAQKAKAALDSDQVDVAMIAGAAAQNASNEGYHKITDGVGYVNSPTCIATSQDFYDKYPTIVERFLKTHQEIIDFIKQNQDEALQLATKELDLDIKDVEEMFAQYEFTSSISDQDIQGIQETIEFMLESEMIEEEIQAKDLVFE